MRAVYLPNQTESDLIVAGERSASTTLAMSGVKIPSQPSTTP